MDRYKWRDAVLESDLTATEKVVALVFEWHASQNTVRVWCAPERLQRLTSLGRTASKRAVQLLVSSGWLTVTEQARQHRAARYALTIPRGSGGDPLEEFRGSLEDARGSLDGIRGSRSDPDPCSIPVHNPAAGGEKKLKSPRPDALARFQLTDAERADFIRSLGNNVRSPGALLKSLDDSGELERRVKDWRGTSKATSHTFGNPLINCPVCETRHPTRGLCDPDDEEETRTRARAYVREVRPGPLAPADLKAPGASDQLFKYLHGQISNLSYAESQQATLWASGMTPEHVVWRLREARLPKAITDPPQSKRTFWDRGPV